MCMGSREVTGDAMVVETVGPVEGVNVEHGGRAYVKTRNNFM